MPVSSKEFFDIQANIEWGFTLKCVRDMIKTYNHYLFDLFFDCKKALTSLKLEILIEFSCSVMWIMLPKIFYLLNLPKLCIFLRIKAQHWNLELSANRLECDITVYLNYAARIYLRFQ